MVLAVLILGKEGDKGAVRIKIGFVIARHRPDIQRLEVEGRRIGSFEGHAFDHALHPQIGRAGSGRADRIGTKTAVARLTVVVLAVVEERERVAECRAVRPLQPAL